MPFTIEIIGLTELRDRMARYPEQMDKAMELGFQRALLQVWESVFPYPPQPEGSRYIRKVSGGLGGSLGIGESGGQQGSPDIYEVKQTHGYTEARFGSRLGYAQYVIGDRATQQAGHMRHWWTLPQDVFEAASPKIEATFQTIVDKLGKWLEGKGE